MHGIKAHAFNIIKFFFSSRLDHTHVQLNLKYALTNTMTTLIVQETSTRSSTQQT
jgi:hypothetical protein